MGIVVEDLFWYEDSSVIFHKDRLVEFIPMEDHTYEEWLNASLRFSFYTAILIFIFSRNYTLLVTIPIMAACGTFFCYYRNKEYVDPFDDDQFPCTRPTNHNPMMNVMLDDIHMNPPKKEACDVNHMNKEMDKLLEKSVYKNAFDVMGDEFRNRHFFTMPNTTVPNKQTDFGDWLYKTPDTCKTNPEYCKVDEDIRQERDTVTTYMDSNRTG